MDDDPQLLRMIAEWMAEAGYDVIPRGSFEDARACLTATTPDLLLADVRLGAFNGLHLAFRVRQLGRQAAVLLMSGYDDPVVRRDATTWGAGFILKPFERTDLLAAVDGALKGCEV